MADDQKPFVTYDADDRPVLVGPAQMSDHRTYVALKARAKREGRGIQYVNSEEEYNRLTSEQPAEPERSEAGVHSPPGGDAKIYMVSSSAIGNSAKLYAMHKAKAKELGMQFRVIGDTLGPGAA